MATVSTTLPSDGQTIDAADVNTPINAILSEFNGNIDNDNIKTGANINGSKLADDSITGTKLDDTLKGGWLTGELPAVSSVTANGNRSYDVVFASTVASILSPGMRLRTTRTAAAPNTAFSLDGSNDYYVKTSPNKLTFTDDFSVSAWVYVTAYQAGSVVSRYNGTSGWNFALDASGVLQLSGVKGGSGNYSYIKSYQSIPLNRWVHIAAQLDMSAFTATTTTSYIMIDGKDVPALVGRAGTNPTDLTQAGNLEVGSTNGGTAPFPGYLDQVAVYSAKVLQATHLAAMNQALTGSETNLASAYSNGSTSDLNTTTPNDLTATNGATTVSSSPFGNRGVSTTLDYALVMNVSTTTATVQVPEGCTIDTANGISAVAYSTQANPYGWVWSDEAILTRECYVPGSSSTSSTSYADLADSANASVTVYIGRSGKALVTIGVNSQNSAADGSSFTSFIVSGATTQAGSDTKCAMTRLTTAAASSTVWMHHIENGLNSGETTFSIRHRAGANTSTFLYRRIAVTPL